METFNSIENITPKIKEILTDICDEECDTKLTFNECYYICLDLLNEIPTNDYDDWFSLLEKRKK